MRISPGQQFLRFVGHRPWLRGRTRVIKAFSNPDNQKPHPFEVDFFGQVYSGDLANFIDWTVFYYGAFALHELHLLADLAQGLRTRGKQINFFDVGGNIGHHALFMSPLADQVFSFEPYSVVRDEMVRKLTRADARNVNIFPVALGDRDESHVFHPPTGANLGTGTLGELLPDNAASHSISVQVVRGDAFFPKNNLPPISLLKMDVEGHEEQALDGMRETLRRDRPPIFLEVQRGPDPSFKALKGQRIQDLLYPDCRVFEVNPLRGRYILQPFSAESSEEVLVLPNELDGIVPGSGIAR